jgi:hypothetical protein
MLDILIKGSLSGAERNALLWANRKGNVHVLGLDSGTDHTVQGRRGR